MSLARKHRTIAGSIAAELRNVLLSGGYPAGSQLRQDALAATYGVSRIPVREALLQLEAEGLVAIVPHKGAVVASLSRADVEDVFALRALLEPRLLLKSAPLLERGDFVAIDSVQAAFAEAIRLRDSARWGALNAELHGRLYARADMPRTRSIVAGLLTASERYTRIQLATEAQWRRADAEHGELIDLCRNGEAERAARLLVAHIEAVRDDLLALLGDRLSDAQRVAT